MTDMTTRTAAAATDGGDTAERLRRYLDGEYAEIKEKVRAELAKPELRPVSPDIGRAEYREEVLKRTRTLAERGETSRGFPEEYGGEGNVGGAVAGFQTLGHGDLSLLVKCGVQFGLFGGAVLHLGNEEHHRRYLADIVSVDLPGCFAMTESGHGSDVQSLRTTAVYDPDCGDFVVHTPDEEARKDYIGNAACHGRMAVVFAQLRVDDEDHGVHALLVPIRDDEGNALPGVTLEDCGPKLGLEGVDNGRIAFDNVHVPRENLLDRYGSVGSDGAYSSPIESANRRFFTTIGTLIQGRVSVSGASISATKSALTIAIRHGLRRRQFGPPGSGEELPLLDYRAHQRRLLLPLAKAYALHFAQEVLVAELHRAFTEEDYEERDKRQLEAYAAGVKATATWHATATIQTCREACGGAGYMAVNRFAAMKADTDVFTTFEGDNTILLQLVAKGMLTDYNERFGDLGQLEMVRFFGAQVWETVMERSLARQLVTRVADAVPGAGEDDPDLEDREYQLDLFRWREEHILTGVAQRLKRGIDDGGDSFEVLNEVQDHVLAAAQAHVDRLILDAFAGAVERCEDEEVRELLDKLCHLHVLANVEADRGWFFEHGRMTGPRAKGVTRAINRLCGELREHAAVLVDAFGIPDETLGEIGRR